MESIKGLYKAECTRTTVFHDGPYKTIADVEHATTGWVDWYTTTEGSTRPWETSHRSSTSKPTTLPPTESRTPYRTAENLGRFNLRRDSGSTAVASPRIVGSA